MWRPPDWPDANELIFKLNKECSTKEVFELGATTMIDRLKSEGIEVTRKDGTKGIIVLIPDKKDG